MISRIFSIPTLGLASGGGIGPDETPWQVLKRDVEEQLEI